MAEYPVLKPVIQSRYHEARLRPLYRAPKDMILEDGSGFELGLRALADIQIHSDRPCVMGGIGELEATIRRGGMVVFDEGKFWFYDIECGVWVDVSPVVIERYIQSYAGVSYGDPTRNNVRKRMQLETAKVKSARQQAETAVTREQVFAECTVPGLQFLDKFIWFDTEKNELRQQAPNPDLFQRDQYPFSCPPIECLSWSVDDDRWREMCPPLWHILEGSFANGSGDWRAIQQRFGLALFGQSNLVRGSHLWFVGPKGCGKNTISLAFASLFPPSARTGVPLFDVQEYRTSPLQRSRINVCGEVRRVQTVEYLKDATSDSLLPIRKAGSEEKTIYPRFLLIFASNSPPQIVAEADSVLDRFVLVPFKHFGGPARPHLRQEMEACAQGLIGWAMSGFMSWVETGELAEGATSQELKGQWLRRSDPLAYWLEECLEPSDDGYFGLKEAWRYYSDWCDDNGVERRRKGDYMTFADEIRSRFTIEKVSHYNVAGVRGYRVMPDGRAMRVIGDESRKKTKISTTC